MDTTKAKANIKKLHCYTQKLQKLFLLPLSVFSTWIFKFHRGDQTLCRGAPPFVRARFLAIIQRPNRTFEWKSPAVSKSEDSTLGEEHDQEYICLSFSFKFKRLFPKNMSQESDCRNRVLGNVLGKILTENNQHWSVSLWDGTFLARITIFSHYWPDLPDLTSLPWFLVS